MKTDKKKLAAAISAVYAYLSSYENVAYVPSEDGALQDAAQQNIMVAGPQPNFWGMSGRQAQMQANTMMQMRAFK